MLLILDVIFGVVYLYDKKQNNKEELIKKVSNCQDIGEEYYLLVKNQISPTLSVNSANTNQLQEIVKQRQIQLRFQKIYARIIDLCNLKLTDVSGYQKLTGDMEVIE